MTHPNPILNLGIIITGIGIAVVAVVYFLYGPVYLASLLI